MADSSLSNSMNGLNAIHK
jgi:hypothetical protein